MSTAKRFGVALLAALLPLTFAHAEQREPIREALLLHAPTAKIQNFTPVQGVFACHWTCSGNTTEIFCPSGTHCSCTCAGPQPLCACVIPP
jgi:hypothetical protein